MFYYNIEQKPRVFNVEMKLVVISSYNVNNPLIKVYNGKVEHNNPFISRWGFEDLAKCALLEMVKQVTTDPDLLDILRGIEKS